MHGFAPGIHVFFFLRWQDVDGGDELPMTPDRAISTFTHLSLAGVCPEMVLLQRVQIIAIICRTARCGGCEMPGRLRSNLSATVFSSAWRRFLLWREPPRPADDCHFCPAPLHRRPCPRCWRSTFAAPSAPTS